MNAGSYRLLLGYFNMPAIQLTTNFEEEKIENIPQFTHRAMKCLNWILQLPS